MWSSLILLLMTFSHRTRGQQEPTTGGATGAGSAIPLNDEELERIEKEHTRNVVRLAATDQLNSEIITNRTRAYLSCESGEMIVKINFSAPFRGVAYSDYDRTSPCKFFGDGGKYYEMRLPLKGCGTQQEAPRLFINNIIVRFHRSLELEEDEIKTIICRYPPPLAPPPPNVPSPILEATVPIPVIEPAKLSEIELLLIICALLFLTLLLLGIGIAYYCLKRRNIKIIRKKIPSPAPSEVTKISSVFDQIRIPRAQAPSSSSSTDYPSSESEERRTIVSETSTFRNDHFRYENTAFVPEPYPLDNEREDSIASVPLPVAHKPVITTASFEETLLQTEYLREEDVIDTHHKRTTACLYKKLPTTRVPPSIPDNDNWSQAETEDRLPLVPYLPPVQLPRVTSRTLVDTFITNEIETIVDEDTTRHKRVFAPPPPKITLLQTEDVFVTNIHETEVEEQDVREKHEATSHFIVRDDRTIDRRHDQTFEVNRREKLYEETFDRRTEGGLSRFEGSHDISQRRDYLSNAGMAAMTYDSTYEEYSMDVERERDDTFTSVPHMLSRRPSQMAIDFEESYPHLEEDVSRRQELSSMYDLPASQRPSIPDDVWSQAETEVRHALTLGRGGFGVRREEPSFVSEMQPNVTMTRSDLMTSYASDSVSGLSVETERRMTSESREVQRRRDQSYSYQKEFRRE